MIQQLLIVCSVSSVVASSSPATTVILNSTVRLWNVSWILIALTRTHVASINALPSADPTTSRADPTHCVLVPVTRPLASVRPDWKATPTCSAQPQTVRTTRSVHLSRLASTDTAKIHAPSRTLVTTLRTVRSWTTKSIALVQQERKETEEQHAPRVS